MLCALALGAGTAAGAGPSDYPTFVVEFERSQNSFAGKIDSRKGRCEKDRKVILYRKRDKQKNKLGADKTNDKGKFKVRVGANPDAGKYFAQVKSRNFANGTCRGEKSAKVELN